MSYEREGFLRWIGSRTRKDVGFCVTIGNPHGRARLRIHEMLCHEGLTPVTIAHPTAFIDPSASIGVGSQILAGALIMAEARLGRQCIINTNASVDHEDVLDDGVEIAPGAILCGVVQVGMNGWVCAGATVLPHVRIGADAIVGAGAVVLRDVPDGVTVVGVPAKPIKRRTVGRL